MEQRCGNERIVETCQLVEIEVTGDNEGATELGGLRRRAMADARSDRVGGRTQVCQMSEICRVTKGAAAELGWQRWAARRSARKR